jgi:DNA-binding transcriptional regulator YhcF (GntR family)
MYAWQSKPRLDDLLWAHIRRDVRAAIARGHLPPGDRTPTEKQFEQAYQCSRSTVRTALEKLANDGLIIKRRSSGTIVAPDALEKLRRLELLEKLDQPTTGKTVQLPPGAYVPTKPTANVARPAAARIGVILYPGAELVVREPTEAEVVKHDLQQGEDLGVISYPDGRTEEHGVFTKAFRVPTTSD